MLKHQSLKLSLHDINVNNDDSHRSAVVKGDNNNNIITPIPPSLSWHCIICTYENSNNIKNCEMCHAEKPSGFVS